NHSRQRLAAQNRLDLPHRRCLYAPARPPHRIPSHPPVCRWRPLFGHPATPPRGPPTAFEATPLYVDGVLYLATPLGRILALDPSTGKLKWAYDAKVQKDAGYGAFGNHTGYLCT